MADSVIYLNTGTSQVAANSLTLFSNWQLRNALMCDSSTAVNRRSGKPLYYARLSTIADEVKPLTLKS